MEGNRWNYLFIIIAILNAGRVTSWHDKRPAWASEHGLAVLLLPGIPPLAISGVVSCIFRQKAQLCERGHHFWLGAGFDDNGGWPEGLA